MIDFLFLISPFAMHCLSCSLSQAEPVLSRDGSRLDDDFTNLLCVPQVWVDDNWLFFAWLCIGHARKRGHCDSVVQIALTTFFVKAFSCVIRFDTSTYLISLLTSEPLRDLQELHLKPGFRSVSDSNNSVPLKSFSRFHALFLVKF